MTKSHPGMRSRHRRCLRGGPGAFHPNLNSGTGRHRGNVAPSNHKNVHILVEQLDRRAGRAWGSPTIELTWTASNCTGPMAWAAALFLPHPAHLPPATSWCGPGPEHPRSNHHLHGATTSWPGPWTCFPNCHPSPTAGAPGGTSTNRQCRPRERVHSSAIPGGSQGDPLRRPLT